MKKDIIVNKKNRLNSDFVPSDLVLYKNSYANHIDKEHQIYVEKETLYYFNIMAKDAYTLGYNIVIDSAYRSYDYQNVILNNFIEKIGNLAYSRVALPGTSEHQTGLAIDISIIKEGKYVTELSNKIEEMDWLFNNAHKYGFILRYPQNKENITGYRYEPWHFRYVGIKIANFIYTNNITLEEYYKQSELMPI